MCLRHDPENPSKSPVTDRWQAVSYASTRIFLPSPPSHNPPGIGLDDAVFEPELARARERPHDVGAAETATPELARARERHDGLVYQERAERFHKVQ